MPFDKDAFLGLCNALAQIDLLGSDGSSPPWGDDDPTEEIVRPAIEAASPLLPSRFQAGYVAPLSENLRQVLIQGGPELTETLAGAVYQHGTSYGGAQPLRRFLAVVSDLYRSFLAKEQRAQLDLPLAERLPPLAMFQHDGQGGPFTIPADEIKQICGAQLGVVSVPAAYKAHPLLWVSLAHETGGHDVLHADQGLLEELAAGVRKLFSGAPQEPGREPTREQLLGLLWSHWIDEAASDVYGLLNVGPAFGQNMVAFFAALNARSVGGLTRPLLRIRSGGDEEGILDDHPTDVLRIELAAGVIGALTSLSESTRKEHVATLEALASLANPEGAAIELKGRIPVGSGSSLALDETIPLDVMRDAARKVGAFIATVKLNALGGHSIQEIETWDDADEAAARQISAALQAGGSVVELGDDAQLLAGATLALAAKPELYDAVSRAVEQALDASYERDPIWSGRDRG